MDSSRHRDASGGAGILVSEILSGLSHALDITEGHPRGHAARSCLIAMRLAQVIGLGETDKADLFYAAILKDAGCSSNAARVHQLFGGNEHEVKRGVWVRDWRQLHQQAMYALQYAGRGESLYRRLLRMGKLAAAGQSASRELFQIRCDRGALIASGLGLSDATASAIRSMDEHWDGGGHPEGLRGDRIPLLARIVGLAQVAEIFGQNGGPQAAFDVVWKRRKRWFDPELVDGFKSVAADQAFWTSLRTADERQLLSGAEPVQSIVVADDKRLDTIAEAFASVIDAKSPFTADHSRRVSNIAVRISATLGYSAAAQQRLRRAALLHDIGKLGVPNSILDKPSALTGDEWTVVRKHPAYTYEILSRVPGFRDLAFDASCHHEKLDGSGYHQGLRAEALSQPARILAVADIADALLADRPYRRGLPAGETLSQLRSECERGALCGVCVEAAVQAVNVEVLSIDSRTRQASAAS